MGEWALELALVAWAPESCPKSMSAGELALPLAGLVVAQAPVSWSHQACAGELALVVCEGRELATMAQAE